MLVASSFDDKVDVDGNRKRKKLFGDERLHRNRERNRMHARKTRERKKQQSNALQSRLTELESEGSKLRQIVDDRYTASVLLGLSQTFQNSLGENHNILSSANVCRRASDNSSLTVATLSPHCNDTNFGGNYVGETAHGACDPVVVTKRVRRRGKYTPQERERIRRERNRMHAKRTRDRKKKLLEDSETIIVRMERESQLLRGYCVSLNMLSMEDATKLEERASESKRELAALKACQGEYDIDCDEDDDNEDNNNDDNGDGDDEHDNDGSLSGSDDNEKSCSWNGSNNESESINGSDSINGDTSGDARSSSGSSSSSSSKNNHSSDICSNIESGSASSRSHNSSGSGSGSGGDSPIPKHASSNWKKEEGFNYGIKPQHIKQPGTYSTKLQHVANAYPPHAGLHSSVHAEPAVSSQSVESYNHGGVMNSSNVAIAPATVTASNPSTLAHEIRSTLVAASDFLNVQKSAIPTARKIVEAQSMFTAHTTSCDTYSLSLGPVSLDPRPTAMPQARKTVKQAIQLGVPVLIAPSDKSSCGLFSPIPSMNSQTTSMQQASHRQVDNIRGTVAPQCRNFPLWYPNNSAEPL